MQAVIIAAGESSRFWPLNKDHKSLVSLLGKSIVSQTLKGLVANNVKDITVVCGPNSALPATLKKEDIAASLRFVVQEKPLGTGDALFRAKEFIKEPFFVVWPSKVDSERLAKVMVQEKQTKGVSAVFLGVPTSRPWDFGVARLEEGKLREIVENPKQGEEPSSLKVTGFYLLDPNFFSFYEKLPRHHEADFIDALNLYLKEENGSLIRLEELEEDVSALRYPWELFGILDILFRMQGEKQVIAPSARIGEGTVIDGPVFIGENCDIGSYNVLRGPLNLEAGVKTGAFMEIKHSIIQEGTHFHSGYIGDSIIGKNCRFGAGFIAANRRLDRNTIASVVKGTKVDTKLSYWGTVVGDETYLGIHTGTMPGVFIGQNCVIGPGTQIFKNVEDNTTIFTTYQQEQKRA